MKIHVTPGVDARAAARDLLETGAVGIDDIGENQYDGVRDELFEDLGHVVDDLDIKTQRVETRMDPVFVLSAGSGISGRSIPDILAGS